MASWERNPEYRAAIRSNIRPGEPSFYVPARQCGTGTDVTDFQIGTGYYNIHILPRIFYQLYPSQEWKDYKSRPRPRQKRDRNGQLMFEQYPRPGKQPREILDFPIFKHIDKISTEAEWWEFEMWFRFEPRLRWSDIDMRMEYRGSRATISTEQKFHNALNQRCIRARREFRMIAWRDVARQSKGNKTRDEVLARLSPAQKAANTTAGTTPGSMDGNGAIIPVLQRFILSGQVPHPHPLTPPIQQSIVQVQHAQAIAPQQSVGFQSLNPQQAGSRVQPYGSSRSNAIASSTATQTAPQQSNDVHALSKRKRKSPARNRDVVDHGFDEEAQDGEHGSYQPGYNEVGRKRRRVGQSPMMRQSTLHRQVMDEDLIDPSLRFGSQTVNGAYGRFSELRGQKRQRLEDEANAFDNGDFSEMDSNFRTRPRRHNRSSLYAGDLPDTRPKKQVKYRQQGYEHAHNEPFPDNNYHNIVQQQMAPLDSSSAFIEPRLTNYDGYMSNPYGSSSKTNHWLEQYPNHDPTYLVGYHQIVPQGPYPSFGLDTSMAVRSEGAPFFPPTVSGLDPAPATAFGPSQGMSLQNPSPYLPTSFTSATSTAARTNLSTPYLTSPATVDSSPGPSNQVAGETEGEKNNTPASDEQDCFRAYACDPSEMTLESIDAIWRERVFNDIN